MQLISKISAPYNPTFLFTFSPVVWLSVLCHQCQDVPCATSPRLYGAAKKYPPNFFWQYFPNEIKFTRSYCVYIYAKIYSIISDFGKVISVSVTKWNFTFHLKNTKKCDISATVRPISTKFNVITQNVSISNSKMTAGQLPFWKSKNCNT